MKNNLEGKRVKLIHMKGEDQKRMYPGLEGEIRMVDDLKQIHVNWDNGSTLALIPEEDEYQLLEEKLKKFENFK